MSGSGRHSGTLRSGIICAWWAVVAALPCLAVAAPDLEGIWMPAAGASDGWLADPPLSEEGLAAWTDADPSADVGLQCLFGMPRIIGVRGPYPIEFIQRDDRVAILYEQGHQVRRIFLDGREPAEGHTLLGHSNGIYEEDTLVVETTLIREQPNPGPPLQVLQSDEMRVIERYRTLDDGQTLEAMITIDDPKYYTEPWTIRKAWSRSDDEVFYEYVCSDPRYHPVPGN